MKNLSAEEAVLNRKVKILFGFEEIEIEMKRESERIGMGWGRNLGALKV